MSLLWLILLLTLTWESSWAHMRMSSPKPRGDPSDRATGRPDYSLTSPLSGANRPFPCQGKPATSFSTEVTAGQDLPVTIIGSAIHGGNGHCQYSLSYDGGRTFVSIFDQIGTCFAPGRNVGSFTYQIPFPSGLPAGPAIFAWTWYNKIGNREIYMNCADINIKSHVDRGALTGPRLFIAQLPGTPRLAESTNGGPLTGASYLAKGARPLIRVDNMGGSVLVARGTNPGDIVTGGSASQGQDGAYLSGRALKNGITVGEVDGMAVAAKSEPSSDETKMTTTPTQAGMASRAPSVSHGPSSMEAVPSRPAKVPTFTTQTSQAKSTSSGRPPVKKARSCTVGAMRCVGKKRYKTCTSDHHTILRDVAPGTRCINVGPDSIRLAAS